MLNRRKAPNEVIVIDSPDGEISASFSGEQWLLDVINENDGDLYSSCGGMGTCGTCRIVVTEGEELLDARNEIEAEMADIRGYETCERLACQTLARPGLKIKIP